MTDTEAGRLHTVTPYLTVAGAADALLWYADVFGATPSGEPWIGEDGRIGHAEMVLGDSTVMISDEHPEIGVLGPSSRGGVTASLHLGVDDADAVVARAAAAGATVERPVADQGYGRLGVVIDPWGQRWMVNATRRVEG